MSYWRVEFRVDGSVESVLEMDRGAPEDVFVVYVRADDSEHAVYRARQRLPQRERRARYDREGKCLCGRPRAEDGHRRCPTCLARMKASRRGEAPRSKGVRQLARRADLKASERLATLVEVQGVWQRCQTNHQFTRWLAGELGKLCPGKAA